MELRKVHKTVVVHGNYEYGIRNKGRAYTLLSVCQRRAGENAIYEMRERQADGCLIIAVKTGVMLRAIIVTPPIPQQEKRKEEVLDIESLVIVIGSEKIGYHVGRISFDGETVFEAEFDKMEDILTSIPRSVAAEPLFSTKKTYNQDDPSGIYYDSMIPPFYWPGNGYYERCPIVAPHCPLDIGSETLECTTSRSEIYEPDGLPAQKATLIIHAREHCIKKDYIDIQGQSTLSKSRFAHKIDYSQISENINDIHSCTYVSFSDDAEYSSCKIALDITSMTYLYTYHCYLYPGYPQWTPWNGYFEPGMIGEPGDTLGPPQIPEGTPMINRDQCTFESILTPVGPMMLCKNYKTIYPELYIDGDLKYRESVQKAIEDNYGISDPGFYTDEPFFEWIEHPLFDIFSLQENRKYIYAYYKQPPNSDFRMFDFFAPLRMSLRPYYNYPLASSQNAIHSLFFGEVCRGAKVQIYLDSFLQAFFHGDGNIFNPYEISNISHVVRSAAAVLFPGETLESSSVRNEKFRLAIESFFCNTRNRQHASGLDVSLNVSLSGNIFCYISKQKTSSTEPRSLDNEMELFLEVNRARQLNYKDPLTIDSDLYFAAKMHAIDCARNKLESSTGSDESTPTSRMERTGYQNRFLLICEVGENVAFGQKTSREAFLAWASSPDHWANIINADWVDTGIAVCPDSDGNLYWVQVFGRRE